MPCASTGNARSAFKVTPSTGMRTVNACQSGLAIAIPNCSETGGIRLWHLLVVPVRRRLKGHERRRTVDVYERVKLRRQTRLEIVALPFCLWTIDYTDCTLEQWRRETAELLVVEEERELRQLDRMHHVLDRSVQAGSDDFSLGGAVPVRRRRDRSFVGGKANRDGLAAVALPQQLPEIDLAALAHFRAARVAEMRV